MKTTMAVTLLTALAVLSTGCSGPPTAMDFNQLGLQHFEMRDYDNAQSAFQEAAAIDPTNADYYFNMGAAQQARGRLDDAIISYRTAIRLNPGLIAAHENMALCLLAKDETAAAERAYERMCALNPINSRPFYIFADYWQQRGDQHRTREYLMKAVGANPKDIEARFRLYQFLQKQGETQLAAGHYRTYLELKAAAPELAGTPRESATVKSGRNISSGGVR